jgi:hypothetical protein
MPFDFSIINDVVKNPYTSHVIRFCFVLLRSHVIRFDRFNKRFDFYHKYCNKHGLIKLHK